MTTPPAQSEKPGFLEGKLNVNNLLLFAFGVIFISVMLAFATFFPNPPPFQLKVFVVVLALAAAGIGALLPGLLCIEWGGAIAGIPVVKAGGALGMFALVLAFNPVIESTAVRFVPPTAPAEPVALKYLKAIDAGNTADAWQQLDPEARGLVVPNEQGLATITANFRTPLGAAESRVLVGTGGMESPPGMPVGLYNAVTYKVKFSNDGGQCRAEGVVLRATQDLQWKVFSHQIGPMLMPC